MAIVFAGNPLTGTASNDMIVDYAGNADPNNLLDGLAGNDVLLADMDFFQDSAGSAIGSAVSLTSNSQIWSTAQNSEIDQSTTRPHATATYTAIAVGQAYYAVTVTAGQTITLDVDFTMSGTDTVLEILAPGGGAVVATSDDNGSDVGSVRSLDSFLSYTFLSAGTFLIRVKEYGGDNNFEVGDQYVMNVSLTGQTVTNASPIFGNDTLNGGAGIDYMSGQAGDDTFIVQPGDVAAGEYYHGGIGVDTLQGAGSGSYLYDFSTSEIFSIEKVNFDDAGVGGTATFRFRAAQVGPGLSATTAIAFSGFSDVTDTLAFGMGSATTINLSGLTFTGVGGTDTVIIDGDGSVETITGSAIRDVINGGDGNDTIYGENGADQLRGGIGQDAIYGGLLGDTIHGENGADQLFGSRGDDILFGGRGGDAINGGQEMDTASYEDADAGVTADFVYTSSNTGFAAGDTFVDVENITGSAFGDTISGDSNNNILIGRAGDDFIYGRNGSDTLFGGSGADSLYGGQSNDTLTGGADSDLFSFSGAAGTDTITDFVAGPSLGDAIQILMGTHIDTFAEVQAAMTQSGANTIIDLGGGNTITVLNVLPGSFAGNDFIFT